MTDWKQDKDDPHLWTYEWNPYREMSDGPLPHTAVCNEIRNEAFEEAAKVANEHEQRAFDRMKSDPSAVTGAVFHAVVELADAIRALKMPT